MNSEREDTSALAALSERLDRLESIEEIRQLAAKYSLALDMRDSTAWASLFPEDVRVGDGKTGRAALRAWFERTMRDTFTGTSHHIGGHVIELIDRDTAQGVVYSKNEHEAGAEWVIMQMMYFDRYERVHGRWYFRRRLPLYWYATDLNRPPIGELKMRWPDVPPYEGSFHDLFPSWREFWDRDPLDEHQPIAPPAPLEQFINTMRRGQPLPKVRVA